MSKATPEQIDAILPQTQCGLCGFGGCMPYAEALIYEKAAINLCPPGGVETLITIGELLQQDPKPFIADMEKAAKPKMVAVIRESECIGCTKCIPACPVDAILGSGKQMHTIIADECTGCELCVSPCPVDCIEMIVLTDQKPIEEQKKELARIRFNHKTIRLQKEIAEKKDLKKDNNLIEKRNYIQEAIARAKALKNTPKT